MQNPQENPPPNKMVPIILVVGGNVNTTMKQWMLSLGITDFAHMEITAHSISPRAMQESAEFIKREYGTAEYLFSVGPFADRTLKLAALDHGALPPTHIEDPAELGLALENCKNYLLRRMYHAPTLIGPTDSR